MVSMALYLISPIGALVPMFIWFHLVAFCLSLFFVIPGISTRLLDALEFKQGGNLALSAIAIWFVSVIAVTLDQAVGSGLGPYYFVNLLGLDPAFIGGFFELAIIIYAIERLIGSLILAIVLFALGMVLANSNLGLPFTGHNPFEIQELSEEDIRVEQ
jgi:hypothetical protein